MIARMVERMTLDRIIEKSNDRMIKLMDGWMNGMTERMTE